MPTEPQGPFHMERVGKNPDKEEGFDIQQLLYLMQKLGSSFESSVACLFAFNSASVAGTVSAGDACQLMCRFLHSKHVL